MTLEIGITRFPDRATLPARPLPPMPRRCTNLVRAVVQQARRTPDKVFAYDTATGESTTFKQFVRKSAALSCVIERRFGQRGKIGVLIPPSTGVAIANLAVLMSANAVVNLNLLSKQEIINGFIADAGIRHVITSRKVLEKYPDLVLNAQVACIEDLAESVRSKDKAVAAAASAPITGASEVLPGARRRGEATATIMYTSGTTGDPKGAQLTHRNILWNIWQIKHSVHLAHNDVLLGVLPMFHSFGFTVTLWAVAVLGLSVVFHADGREARTVAELIEKHGVTLVAATPTAMRLWLPRLSREKCKTVRMWLLGSEKLKPELARDIEEKLGVAPSEGYGCTEASPVVSANVPGKVMTVDGREVDGTKIGTVGFPMPGTSVSIVDMRSGEVLGRNQDGLIFIRGPQVMKGYFNKPEETDAVLRDFWYCTGDFGHIDDDGRIAITDRIKRIIKMGGEWVVPFVIESTLVRAAGVTELDLVCVGVPDQAKGERPVILYKTLNGNEPSALCQALPDMGVPPLWVPKPRDFLAVDALPVATTGKLDFKEAARMARERLGLQA